MTEKEKMLNVEYYISCDKELTAEREHAKDLLFEFNSIRPSNRKEREKIIRELFGSVGENSWIESLSTVITAQTYTQEKIFTQIQTAAYLTVPELHSVIMFSSDRIQVFSHRIMHLTVRNVLKVTSVPSR